jgi:hypothetical protein
MVTTSCSEGLTILGGKWKGAGRTSKEVGSTYIKESLVTCVLWGSHARASRNDHFYFSQINVAFTACVLTGVIVSQLGSKGYRWETRNTEKKNGMAFLTVFVYFPLYFAYILQTMPGRIHKELVTLVVTWCWWLLQS